MGELFTQMLHRYQTQALEGDTLEKAAAQLISEQVSFEMASNILRRVYGVGYEKASQYVKVLNKHGVSYNSPELVARFLDDYQSLPEEEKELASTIALLHTRALSVGDALKVMRMLYNISLFEARELLFGHPAWQKEREFSEKMIEFLFSQDPQLDEDSECF